MTERLETRVVPPVRTVDLASLDWRLPVQAESQPLRAARNPRLRFESGRLLGGLAAFHGAGSSAAAVVPDLILLCLASSVLGVGDGVTRVAYPLAAILACFVAGVYRDRDSVETRGALWHARLALAPLVAIGIVGVALGWTTTGQAAALVAVSLALLAAARTVAWLTLVVSRRRGAGLRPTLLVGDPEPVDLVWRRLVKFPEIGLAPVEQLSYATVATPGALAHELDRWQFEHVVLVAPPSDATDVGVSILRYTAGTPYFSVVPALPDLFVSPRSRTEVGGIPLHPLGRLGLTRHRFPGKRVMDVVLGGLLLVCVAPVLAAIALAVKLGDGGPVFYRQLRVGRGGVPFRIVKFRTMVVGAEHMQEQLSAHNVTDGLLFKLRCDPRVTRVGGFLRRTSLDELPQLWNVLRGEMSLVGPRPLAVDPEQFSVTDDRRHAVSPGITGYWQVSGGNELAFAEMVRLDLAYIRDWSLWLDVELLLRTVPAVIHRHGAA